MSDKNDNFVYGMLVGAVITIASFGVFGVKSPSRYCPVALEHTADSLAVVQQLPDCVEYTLP